MDRKSFLRKGALGAAGLVVGGRVATSAGTPAAAPMRASTYDRMREQVGFNHLPNPSDDMSANSVLHRAATRGHANHGWLDTHHTFSFANYRNPERMNFGVLRVLNDDVVAGGKGFGAHPHDNMEIVSIPLEGDLEHQDSMGNKTVIREGDVQVMSAGTGVTHAEYNANSDKPVKFLQIWMFPKRRNVAPRYDQIALDAADNAITQILSPERDDAGVWVHQDAWWSVAKFDAGKGDTYTLHRPGTHGVYAFVLEGEVTVDAQDLGPRDGYGVWDVESIGIRADSDGARVLLMEVPMEIG